MGPNQTLTTHTQGFLQAPLPLPLRCAPPRSIPCPGVTITASPPVSQGPLPVRGSPLPQSFISSEKTWPWRYCVWSSLGHGSHSPAGFLWQLLLSSSGLGVLGGMVWTPLQLSVWPASRHRPFSRATRPHACIQQSAHRHGHTLNQMSW